MTPAQATAEDLRLTETEQKLWDLFVFAKRVMKYDQIGKLHMDWFKSLLENQFLLLLSPRGHLKSTAVTTCYALWRLVNDRNCRVLIVNETLSMSRKLFDVIRQHILGNDIFRQRYGEWEMSASKWTEDSIVIPRTRFQKEPSLSTGGVWGNLVSLHNDLIILDDPVGEKTSYTPHLRQKLLNWFKNVILPALEPDGQLIVVGTRWHSQDLYGHILEDAGFKHWKKIVQSAEWKDDNGNRQILLPERFTPQKLDELRGTMGMASYYCQMLNDVSGQEGSDFKMEWIRTSRYTERPEDANFYIGVDLASGGKDRNSYFAYAVLAIPRGQKDVYVIEAHHDRIDFPTQIKAIKRLAHVHKPTVIAIESNAYQLSLVQMLWSDEETSKLPIVPIITTGDAMRRLRGLSPLLENGTLRLPHDLPDLDDEFLSFPKGTDDLLDAIWLAMRGFHERRNEGKIHYVGDYV